MLTLVLLLIRVHGFCQNQELTNREEFLQKLKEQTKLNQTIKAEFTEERFLSVLKEPQKSNGLFYFKKENYLRWEKTKPQPYIFISANNKIKIKEGGQEKDVSSFNQIMTRINDLMLTLVNGTFQNSKAFSTEYFQNASEYVVKLKPRNKRIAGQFDSIQLAFNKKSMLMDELIFFEKSGDKNVMKFFNQHINEPLNDNLFLNF